MYPVSLAFVVAFHPNLKLEEIFVVRSFNHSFDQLNDVGYLLSETQYFQPIITRQFRECTETVFKNKEMFSCELKFVIVTENSTKCSIFNFNLALGASNCSDEKIKTYFNFGVSKEHGLIRNIFHEDELKHCNKIETFEKYHETFRLFLRIALLLNTRYSSNIKDVPEDCIANFVRENNSEKFEELFIEVDSKNIGWQKNQKMHLYQLATIVYSHLMKLPDKYKIKTVVTKNFYNNVFDLLFGDVVIHHSHITGKIIGYAHDFCNKKFR